MAYNKHNLYKQHTTPSEDLENAMKEVIAKLIKE